jgi:hypothetical protein
VRVIEVIETDNDLHARRFEPSDLVAGNGNFKELYRRCLPLGTCVFAGGIGLAAGSLPGNIEKCLFSMPPKRDSTATGRAGSSISNMIVAISSHPLGNQRVVSRELILQLSVAALLDVQHLLDLLPHRVVILEIKRRIRAYLYASPPLDLGYPATVPLPRGTFGERQDTLARQPALGARWRGADHWALVSVSNQVTGIP